MWMNKKFVYQVGNNKKVKNSVCGRSDSLVLSHGTTNLGSHGKESLSGHNTGWAKKSLFTCCTEDLG